MVQLRSPQVFDLKFTMNFQLSIFKITDYRLTDF